MTTEQPSIFSFLAPLMAMLNDITEIKKITDRLDDSVNEAGWKKFATYLTDSGEWNDHMESRQEFMDTFHGPRFVRQIQITRVDERWMHGVNMYLADGRTWISIEGSPVDSPSMVYLFQPSTPNDWKLLMRTVRSVDKMIADDIALETPVADENCNLCGGLICPSHRTCHNCDMA